MTANWKSARITVPAFSSPGKGRPTTQVVGSLGFSLLILFSILLAGLIWAAGDILALFVIAFVLAYLFDPLVTWMNRKGIPRPWAALIVTGGLMILVSGTLALLGPIAYAQLEDVMKGLQTVFTDVIGRIRQELTPYSSALRQVGLGGLVRQSEQAASDIRGPLASVVSGGIAFAGTLGLTLLMPVLTFYLLKDWPRMIVRVLKEMPPAKRPLVRILARKIDEVLSAFLHGQAWVCLFIGVLYTAGFAVSGLEYAIVLGMMSGALKFLPYIGTAIAFVLTFATAISQTGWDAWLLSGIAATFIVCEVIESSILTPRIIGERVHLPPALVIFAVLIGGKLLGLVGVFIAIPIFAVARVLLCFWLTREKEFRNSRRKRLRPSTQ